MSMQLESVTTSLQTLSGKLTIDSDIEAQLNGMVDKGRQISVKFSNVMAREGGEILRQKDLVVTATSPQAVKTDDIHLAIKAASEALTNTKSEVIDLQTSSHTNIETCRERKRRHDNDITTKQAALESIQGQIVGIDTSIQTAMNDATELDGVAVNLDNRAESLRRAARKKKKRGWLGAAVGVVLAIPTGGASLVAGAAYAGVNMSDAGDCSRKAGDSRNDAAKKRQSAEGLRSQKKALESQKSGLENEIKSIRSQTDQLAEASSVLEAVTRFLLSSLQSFDDVIKALQDTDVTLKDVQSQSDSFAIIQRALAKKDFPEKLEAMAQSHLDKLKHKWLCLEQTLIQNGARPLE